MTYQTHADLGGQISHGAVVPEPEDEWFHADWEPRALALTLAMGATGTWNIDQSRAARETLPDYAERSYYQIWVGAMERLLNERGMLSADELRAGHATQPGPPLSRTLHAADVPAVLARGSATARTTEVPPRFKVGSTVRMRTGAVSHHTRLPGYARGKRGVVTAAHGAHVFADTHAYAQGPGQGEQPCWLYTVAFEGSELWGAESAPGLSVSIDAWDPYMEPA
ncbi:MAG: nitrile hydratase subunit beta [Pseudomonadota bacterium]|nr:nitrile hydratase subunit beta [Pseudomonadota bacterium]